MQHVPRRKVLVECDLDFSFQAIAGIDFIELRKGLACKNVDDRIVNLDIPFFTFFFGSGEFRRPALPY